VVDDVVPWLSASGTSGQAVMLGVAPKNLALANCPAPPELRIFMPARSLKSVSGFEVE
jgi:hypothetical protein